MRDLIMQVLDLQTDYTTGRSEEMSVRNDLVAREMPAWIRAHVTDLFSNHAWLAVDGGGGAGSWAQIPWVRLFDPEHSPRATAGWQVVYLFSADGQRCYLCVMHGSTV